MPDDEEDRVSRTNRNGIRPTGVRLPCHPDIAKAIIELSAKESARRLGALMREMQEIKKKDKAKPIDANHEALVPNTKAGSYE